MTKTFSRLIIALILVVVFAACTPETPEEIVPTISQSPPTVTATKIVPSATTTVKPTVTPTEEPTATSTSAPTATEEPAVLTINQNAICRLGPGTLYGVETYLTEGTQGSILGQVEGGTWWLIDLGDDIDLPCWVSHTVSFVAGGIDYVPILTPPPLPTLPLTPTTESVGLVYYMIAENTGGPVGCGDSLVPIYVGTGNTGSLDSNVRTALNALFAHHTKYVDGLLNPIYESRMKAKGVDLDTSTGTARVQLGGTFVKPVDVCESKRMHAQVFFTVYQFKKIEFAAIFINNVLLGDLMEK